MQTISQALSDLNGMAAPAALITACSLLLLGVYDKYSKIVASLRALHGELRESDESDDLTPHRKLRTEQITSECCLLQRRLRGVLSQILAVALAMILFLLASLSIGVASLFSVPISSAAVFFVIVGVGFLIVAMILAASEARFIWDVISTELKPIDRASDSIDRFVDSRSTATKGHAQ